MTQTMFCGMCNQDKPADQFNDRFHGENLRYHYRLKRCKECLKAYTTNQGYRSPRWSLLGILNNLKARSVKKKLGPVTITIKDLMALMEKNNRCCSLTGIEFTWYGKGDNEVNGKHKWNSMSVDRIDSSKGYTPDNIQLILNCLNMFKGQMTMEQTMMIAKAFVEKSGELYTEKEVA